METVKINRLNLITKIKAVAQIENSFQSAYFGKNFYFIGDDKDEPDYQIEFIPASQKYFFTILVRGLKREADEMHEEIKQYLQSLNLNRNIVLDTEHKQTLIN